MSPGGFMLESIPTNIGHLNPICKKSDIFRRRKLTGQKASLIHNTSKTPCSRDHALHSQNLENSFPTTSSTPFCHTTNDSISSTANHSCSRPRTHRSLAPRKIRSPAARILATKPERSLLRDAMTFQKALGWTSFWIGLSALVAIGIFYFAGPEQAEAFVTGYLLEKSLSFDNLFVFLMLFTFFGVSAAAQQI